MANRSKLTFARQAAKKTKKGTKDDAPADADTAQVKQDEGEAPLPSRTGSESIDITVE